MKSLRIDINNCRYRAMIGVGGVGSGSMFLLNGNHTLGREESRSGRFLDQKDYCKLHIIFHYVQTLLGREIPVIPISKVGDDEIGRQLLKEISETGMVMKYMQKCDSDTLFAVCFCYPDKSGGNLTVADSACSKVDAEFVASVEQEFIPFKGRGIVLAAPEVPIEARVKLLEMGREYGFFNTASFISEEMMEVVQSDMLGLVDLLAINLDEAAASVAMSVEKEPATVIIEAAISKFRHIHGDIKVSITNGKEGSWMSDGASLTHVQAFEVPVASTAGAGDAHLAGIIVGLTAGLSLQEAQELGTLTGSLSVTSPHTINKEVNRESLRSLAEGASETISGNVLQLLRE